MNDHVHTWLLFPKSCPDTSAQAFNMIQCMGARDSLPGAPDARFLPPLLLIAGVRGSAVCLLYQSESTAARQTQDFGSSLKDVMETDTRLWLVIKRCHGDRLKTLARH
ncbi:hypothetical protein RRG08_007603 [Elysia crispata]|uniref:Uncharacterized protein n=1 Tax=Elysia crispata TaxID=231223 RepID=A0AAE1AHZ7_9GAST|nr:hypothetical protein RRG08_007603 [Elysia crispata]